MKIKKLLRQFVEFSKNVWFILENAIKFIPTYLALLAIHNIDIVYEIIMYKKVFFLVFVIMGIFVGLILGSDFLYNKVKDEQFPKDDSDK
jgi:hypothetical protein